MSGPRGISSAHELETWSRTRWWITLGVVVAGQVGLILWFGEPPERQSRKPAPAPVLGLLGSGAQDILELQDPTLFALPNQRGFSGPAWLNFVRSETNLLDWNEPPRWLPLATNDLGTVFQAFARTNSPREPTIPPSPLPSLTQPSLTPVALARKASRLRVEGDLKAGDLVTGLELGPQEAADLLTNTIVQVLVDPTGAVISPTLLQRSGSAEADRVALAQARSARFVPAGEATDPAGPLRWATMVFEWRTVAPAVSNAPPAAAPAT